MHSYDDKAGAVANRADGTDPAGGTDPADSAYPAGGAHPPGGTEQDGAKPTPGTESASHTQPDSPANPANPDSPDSPDSPGIAGLSLPSQVVAALALALIAATVLVHLGMVFLHVSPSNTVSRENNAAVNDWINPEFEQNWKLFAPNPLQQNVAVQGRAQIRTASGQWRTTEWIDFSAQDAAQIRGSLLPSHTVQNELRRAWDFYTGWHDEKNRSLGARGGLSERYIRRIVLERMSALDMGGAVARVQVRSRTTAVKPPPWSKEKVATTPVYRTLPWWSVTQADLTKVADEAGVTK